MNFILINYCMNKTQESMVSCSEYPAKSNWQTRQIKRDTCENLTNSHHDIKSFIASLKEFIKNGEFESLLAYVDFSIQNVLDSNPKILFWIYKCLFLGLKRQKNIVKAEEIYRKFLFPSYQKSDKFKNKITTFSVILHSQNINMAEITGKIDKYSDKFLNLLQGILEQELNFRRGMTICKAGITQMTHYGYCENKHRLILNKLDINEDDYYLSDLEDQILKTCQGGSFTPEHKMNTYSSSVTKKTIEVFSIKKEPKENTLSENLTTSSDKLFNEINNKNYDKIFILDKLKMDVEEFQDRREIEEINLNNIKTEENKQDYLEMKIDINKKFEIIEPNVSMECNETSISNGFIAGNLNIQQFAQYVDSVQDSKIYQPLRNIFPTTGIDTWHDSRKSSENYMEVDEDDVYEMDLVAEAESNYSNSSLTTIRFAQSHCTPILNKRKLTYPQVHNDDNFKIPRSNKINPALESCSNLNYYNKPFIPKAKAKEKLKNIVPFLKDFKPKFLKKENIDKKILRKFRNYVKVIYKTEQETLDAYDKIFWKNFTSSNLLPPMKYKEDTLKLEFKSFNTKYLLWLFSKEGCIILYQDFSSKFGDQILQDFITAYDLLNNIAEEGIIEKLKYYVQAIPEIYSKKPNHSLLDLMNTSTDNYTTSNYSHTSKVQSEELLASYLGCEVLYNSGSPFNLNNFAVTETTYPRCGKRIYQRNYYEDYNDDYENCHNNFVDSVMNASFDSVPSS